MASVIIGDYKYTTLGDGAQVNVVDKTKTQYDSILSSVTIDGSQYPVTSLDRTFSGCTALTQAPTIPNSVTNMYGAFYNCSALTQAPTIPNGVYNLNNCFYGCTALTQAPTIPSSVRYVGSCFRRCTALAGNIEVYNIPDLQQSANIFGNTNNPIFIIDKGSGETEWQDIASQYNNVHYEADDNPVPVVSNFTATRVSAVGATTFEANGLYAYIQARLMVYDNLIPVGWTNELKAIVLKDNGTTEAVTWQPAITDYPADVHCWAYLGDVATHTITLQITDSIKENNVEVKSNNSAELSVTVSKSYALVDYYHDTTSNTEGMAIGKYAEYPDLLDVDMPTIFRQAVSVVGDVTVGGDVTATGNLQGTDVVATVNLQGDNVLLDIGNAWIGTSSTGPRATTKVVDTASGDFSLTAGNILVCTFLYGNDTANISLNVDGTGAQTVIVPSGGSTAWGASETIGFIYQSDGFHLVTDNDDVNILKSIVRLGWSDVIV